MAEIPESTKSALAPQISDEWIAERWPDQDPVEVRRRLDALMDKLGETPWRGIPGYPEAMQPVLAWAAMLPVERIETLTAALADVPEHLRDYLYVAEKPAFGEQRVKYENVVGDNGHGMGRQAIAITPYVKGYNLAPWIAAASPGNVGALLAELHRLRAAPPAMDREAVRLDRIKGVSERLLRRMREVARQDGWALAVHGSMTRDLDVIAVPWTDAATVEPAFVEAMRAAIASELGGVAVIGAGEDGRTRGFKVKPNGRRCYTLHSTSEQLVEDENGAHPYVDLSILDFRLSAVGQAFGDGVYAACSALENTDRMADDLIASAWPDYADQYASLLPSTLSADAIRQGESMVRISRDQYPEIIQAARWMDEDNGTPHFQPGVGFIVDDPDGLTVPVRWLEHLPTIEAALAGLDHERPHPDDVDTLEWLVREGKEPTLYESAAHCFVSGEHTPMTAMTNSSRELWIASRFFTERFEGWAFDPGADFPVPNGASFTGVEAWDELVNVDDRTSPEEYPDMCLITRDELIDFMSRATPASHASDGGKA